MTVFERAARLWRASAPEAGTGLLQRGFQFAGNSEASAASTLSSSEDDNQGEEVGWWHYLVVDTSGIRPREDAAMDQKLTGKRAKPKLQPGAVVEVDRRRRAGWTQWLSCADGAGWVFDVSPKDRRVRMVEAALMAGEWSYKVVADQVPVLACPMLPSCSRSTSSSLRSLRKSQPNVSATLSCGDIATVVERLRPLSGKGSFLRLADGRGWVLDFVNGSRTVHPVDDAAKANLMSAMGKSNTSSSSQGGDRTPMRATTTSKGSSGGGLGGGLLSQVLPTSEKACSQAALTAFARSFAEEGRWHYVVLEPRGITLRSSPSWDDSVKLKARIEEGELITVCERFGKDGAQFVRLDDASMPAGQSGGGWVFDRRPEAGARLRLLEVHVEAGSWFYRVIDSKRPTLHRRCSLAASTRTSANGPEKGALVTVSQRVQVGSAFFLKLSDFDAWLCDRRGSLASVEGPVEVQDMFGMGAVVSEPAGIYLRKAPTHEAWARTKLFILQGSTLNVTHTVWLQTGDREERWASVERLGSSGMTGWVLADELHLADLMRDSAPWAAC
eukprot:TRINITY_DN93842_c0_g1_i1.p1 TRINITY_DN93842_c0_g1~~TRINITY_DN93842_c0_g1_i1.p1  ORF type:complete len:556 (+),score=110.31 TRINITY_DN93842_c0_g1_i1:143-1810(+)